VVTVEIDALAAGTGATVPIPVIPNVPGDTVNAVTVSVIGSGGVEGVQLAPVDRIGGLAELASNTAPAYRWCRSAA